MLPHAVASGPITHTAMCSADGGEDPSQSAGGRVHCWAALQPVPPPTHFPLRLGDVLLAVPALNSSPPER